MYSKEITEKFISAYKELEKYKIANPSLYDILKKSNYDMYEQFRNTRNILAHNINIDKTYPILVSEELYNNLINEVIKLKRKVKDIMIVRSKITCAKLDTPLYKVIKFMDDNNYSHIPVVDDNGKLILVISNKNIIKIFADSDCNLSFNKQIKVKDYFKYFSYMNNEDEYYLFVKDIDNAYMLKEMYSKRIDNKKCGLIFVSKSGNSNDKLLGIIGSYELINL